MFGRPGYGPGPYPIPGMAARPPYPYPDPRLVNITSHGEGVATAGGRSFYSHVHFMLAVQF